MTDDITPQPPTDQTALRDRIAAALYKRDHLPGRDPHWPKAIEADRKAFETLADAVMAVLPQPADRPAVLHQAADAVAKLDRRKLGIAADTIRDAWEEGRDVAEDELRRMADETATTETTAAQAAIDRVRTLHRKATHGETCVYCAHGQRLGYDTTWPCDTIRALDSAAQPAAGARQDGAES